MKRKGFLALPFIFLLSSCSMMLAGQKPTGTPQNDTGNNNNNNNSNNNNNDTPKEVNRITLPEDSVVYGNEYYKDITIGDLDLSTRVIESQEKVTYDDLFNLGNKVTISIDVDNEELEKLQADYETGHKTDIYRHCNSVTITLVNGGNTFSWTYEDVGIRQKGNTSRKDVFKNGEIAGLNHFKLSFDETFEYSVPGAYTEDWTGKETDYKKRTDRNFLGLSGIDIKWNKNYDSTHIREIYASKLYRACGLLTQDIGLCDFKFKTSTKTYNFGLCTIYEPATKALIKKHLKEGNLLRLPEWKDEKEGAYGVSDVSYGDFYKASWGVGEGSCGNPGPNLSTKSTNNKKVGVKNFDGTYIPAYDRKTNKDVSYSDPLIKELSNKITNGTYSDIEKLMDLDYFAVAMACNYIIGNPDDFRYNNNNYMLYFSRVDGKAYYMPIDNDRCFGVTKDWNPDGNGQKNRAIFDTLNCKNEANTNDLMLKTVLATSTNRSKAIYLNYIKAIKESNFIKEATFEAFFNKTKAVYESSVTSDFVTIGFNLNDSNNLSYHDYITAKLSKIDLNYTLSGTNTNTNNNDNNTTDDEYYYPSVQITGDFCRWRGADYPLAYQGDGVYTVTVTLTKNTGFKFYNNGWDNGLNWGNKNGDDPHALSLNGGDDFQITGITGTTTVTVTVDVKNLTCTWVIN